ncbi:heterokaryon incompatibility protein [Colletotrichum graminicola]|uniref:Heterokaryon incompatibility protein n=1 Tax=Colletotrichum graminicola (strain M1.001 / M2 / FGSC 10212) TaxID=645133 RepID=E3QXV2_COLGM|nr:heterokaryon incompatibility protein [Colletotrichum graminicola M1.001]EFQ35690.1 heterokaryon incompatibility protein [Colletotrichum graminicola M1.001]WDK14783.1 heterokaryon incompatibility protein [Colletotrichum graminicola]
MNYKNLEISERKIRLITIHPLAPFQQESAPIHCTIETATLPAEPKDYDPSLLPANYVDFDDEVTNTSHEPFGGSFRRDVAKIEGTNEGLMPQFGDKEDSKPEHEIILPLNELATMLSFEDLQTTVQNSELNDKVRRNILLDDSVTWEGKLDTKHLNPFFHPPRPRNRKQPIDPESYVAMSYSWGPEQPTASIYLNGMEVDVRVNLAAGLRRFRTMDYFKRGGKIWVDALCINQSDAAEKASQIPLMSSIYKLAANVIVWLGLETGGSSGVIDTLQMLSSLYRTEYVETFDRSDPFTATAWRHMAQIRLRTSFLRLKTMYSQLDLESYEDDFRLYEFFDRPYWRRLWIIQELCMGRAGMPIVCGSRVTQWRYIRDGALVYTAFSQVLKEKLPKTVYQFTQEPVRNDLSILHVAQIAQLEIHGHRKRLPPVDTSWLPIYSNFGENDGILHGSAFLRALLLASGAQCYHLHDSVYGLLSIPGLPDLGLTVDYTKHITTVLTEFAVACVTKGESLELFSLIDGCGMPVRDAQGRLLDRRRLPSWVPYLARTPEQRIGAIEGNWHASGNKQAFVFDGLNVKPKIRNETVLACYGFIAEIVDGVGALSKPDMEIGSRYAPEFRAGVVQPTGKYTSSSEFGPEATNDFVDTESPRSRVAKRLIEGPRVSWVLTCGTDVQGIKQSFDCLYHAFPEDEPSTESPFYRNWHFIYSSADLLIGHRPLSSYFEPFPREDWDAEKSLTTCAARQAMETRTRNRRLIVTNSGLLGLAPALAQPGDAVMVLIGHGRPVITRRLKDESGQDTPLWLLIGEAFVDGMMEWETMDRDVMSGPKRIKQINFV